MGTGLTTQEVLKFLLDVKHFVQQKQGFSDWQMRKRYPELFRAIALTQKRLFQEQAPSIQYYLLNG